MRSISFFAHQAHFFRSTPGANYPHMQRASSMIRGEQIAKYLGAKLNPIDKYENDVCIYVKPNNFDVIKDGSYVDIIDSISLVRGILKYPNLRAIVFSKSGVDYLNIMGKKNVVVIPQHHCNIDNILRDKTDITTVGVIGSPDSFNYPIDEFSKRLKEIGLDFITSFSWRSRQDVVDFYQKIDIQVSFNRSFTRQKCLRDSLRLKNAASFGIPTVAYPEVNYKEFTGNYIEVRSIDDMIAEIKKLKDKTYYEQWSNKALLKSKEFHISKIAELYKQL